MHSQDRIGAVYASEYLAADNHGGKPTTTTAAVDGSGGGNVDRCGGSGFFTETTAEKCLIMAESCYQCGGCLAASKQPDVELCSNGESRRVRPAAGWVSMADAFLWISRPSLLRKLAQGSQPTNRTVDGDDGMTFRKQPAKITLLNERRVREKHQGKLDREVISAKV